VRTARRRLAEAPLHLRCRNDEDAVRVRAQPGRSAGIPGASVPRTAA
jgi:hypothetical protein